MVVVVVVKGFMTGFDDLYDLIWGFREGYCSGGRR